MDGVQGLLIGHKLRDDGQVAASAVLESFLANGLCAETFGLAVEQQRQEVTAPASVTPPTSNTSL